MRPREVQDPTRATARLRLAALAAFALPLFIYSLGWRYLGSGDTAPAELLPISMLTEGNLDFNEFQSSPMIPYWFRLRDGRLVSNYPILPGLINVPVYAVARLGAVNLFERRFRLSMYTAILVASLSTLFVYLTLNRLHGSRRRALGFAFVYAFGTGVWSVASRGLFQHGPALLFLSVGLYLIVRGSPRSVSSAGLCLALAVLARPTNLALAVPLAAFVALRHRSRLPAFLGLAAIPAALHGLYCWRYWGTPFSLGQEVPAGSFSGDPLQGLAGLLVSPSRGLLVFSPIFLFAIPASIAAFRRPADSRGLLTRCLSAGSLLVLAIYSFWSMWWGGHSFGYRLILELALPLVVLIAADWPRIRRSRAATSLFGMALAISIFVQSLGAFVYPSRFNATVDEDPMKLWDLRNSEIVLSVEKLLRYVGHPVTLASEAVGEATSTVGAPQAHWWTRANDDPLISLAVDGPSPGALVRGPVTVFGWAMPTSTDAGEVWISIQPGGRQQLADRFPRPDVAKAVPWTGDASRAGFGARFELESRHLEQFSLFVEVRAANGRVRRLGPVRFLWAPARPAR